MVSVTSGVLSIASVVTRSAWSCRLLTRLAWARCSRGIRHARRALGRVRRHMLYVILSSSSRPSWHRRLSSSSRSAWRTRRSSVPLTSAVSVRGGVPFCTARPSVCVVDFRCARHGIRSGVLLCLTWPSVCLAVFRSAWCSIRGGGSVLSGAAVGMHGGLPFRSAQHTRRCSVLPGAAYAVVFCPVWRGLRYARPFSVLPGVACAAFFRSAWCGVRGVLPFCPALQTRRCLVLSGAARCAPGLAIVRPARPGPAVF